MRAVRIGCAQMSSFDGVVARVVPNLVNQSVDLQTAIRVLKEYDVHLRSDVIPGCVTSIQQSVGTVFPKIETVMEILAKKSRDTNSAVHDIEDNVKQVEQRIYGDLQLLDDLVYEEQTKRVIAIDSLTYKFQTLKKDLEDRISEVFWSSFFAGSSITVLCLGLAGLLIDKYGFGLSGMMLTMPPLHDEL